MTISHEKAQERLQKLCDEYGIEGIPCRACNKMIYPPETVGDYKVTPPESYHYIKTGGHEMFIHIECMRRLRNA